MQDVFRGQDWHFSLQSFYILTFKLQDRDCKDRVLNAGTRHSDSKVFNAICKDNKKDFGTSKI